MPLRTLDDLFLDTLKDIFYAEKAILKALPKMAKSTSSEELREAFEHHLEETRGQVDRLEQVFEIIGKPARGKKCEAIEGIIAEGDAVMQEVEDEAVCDAGLLAGAQAVEHYEIARYGTLIAWAKVLGHDEAVDLLEETLDQEKNADETLTDIAEASVNEAAAGEDRRAKDDDEEEAA